MSCTELTGGSPFFVTEMVAAATSEVPSLGSRPGAGAGCRAQHCRARGARSRGRARPAEADPPCSSAAGANADTFAELLTCGIVEAGGHRPPIPTRDRPARGQSSIAPHRLGDCTGQHCVPLLAAAARTTRASRSTRTVPATARASCSTASRPGGAAAELASHREAASQFERVLRHAASLSQPRAGGAARRVRRRTRPRRTLGGCRVDVAGGRAPVA